MKVVFITRSTLYTVRGGDTVQVCQTARHLQQLGICAEIRLTGEAINYEEYDLLHFFNITRPADILFHIHKAQKPFVITTILIDYSDFDKNFRKGLAGLLLRFLSADNLEYVKTIGRFLKGQDRLMTRSYLWKGQRRSIREIISGASVLFSNSEMETRSISHRYGRRAECVTVSNGVDTQLFAYDEQIAKDDHLVLCVARIEGIKNQINLIRALNNTAYQLLLIGAAAPNQPAYYRECRKIAGPNIHFMEFVDQRALVYYYQRAKVHVLPSWFEACGLSSLEAAAMGCNIVITDKGYTREYFGGDAFYCVPGSPESILRTIEAAASAAFPEKLKARVLSGFTWPQAARQIAKAYQHIQPTYEYPHWHHRIERHPQPLRRF